ncbi:hypothetical protein WN55_07942 [Dufourea novaeangliae]|uniref:Uncharacterized protein n=1 Tax=Dufourea novaeangliae TaxID=178035 RepID=A0A154PSM9_DUFNO|nr:hypothetical protein WN55_07942 [Dufourea novaeangliae]
MSAGRAAGTRHEQSTFPPVPAYVCVPASPTDRFPGARYDFTYRPVLPEYRIETCPYKGVEIHRMTEKKAPSTGCSQDEGFQVSQISER